MLVTKPYISSFHPTKAVKINLLIGLLAGNIGCRKPSQPIENGDELAATKKIYTQVKEEKDKLEKEKNVKINLADTYQKDKDHLTQALNNATAETIDLQKKLADLEKTCCDQSTELQQAAIQAQDKLQQEAVIAELQQQLQRTSEALASKKRKLKALNKKKEALQYAAYSNKKLLAELALSSAVQFYPQDDQQEQEEQESKIPQHNLAPNLESNLPAPSYPQGTTHQQKVQEIKTTIEQLTEKITKGKQRIAEFNEKIKKAQQESDKVETFNENHFKIIKQLTQQKEQPTIKKDPAKLKEIKENINKLEKATNHNHKILKELDNQLYHLGVACDNTNYHVKHYQKKQKELIDKLSALQQPIPNKG